MLRAGWKSLLARRLRLVLSGFAIVLGVAFVSGSLVFTDTLDRAFTGIMSGSVGDVVVSPKGAGASRGDGFSATDRTVPAALVERLATVPGAARADGNVSSFGTFVVAKSGRLIGGTGAPGIAVNATGAPAAHGVEAATLERGRWPSRAGEVALDEATAGRSGYLLGETVALVSSGPEPRISAKLVGVVSFNGGGTAGASIAVLETREAQRLFLGGRDVYQDAWVTAAPGVSQEDLRAAVAKVLPAGYEAVTGDHAAAESAKGVQKALGFITTFLLVFAGVALVVGSFLIVNTFSILVAQRGRELALFRALGASRAQVARSVLLEALAVGVVGSTLGLGLGLVLAVGIRALFATFGLDLGGTPLVLGARTPVAAYAVGVLVTLLAAWLPARRAGRVAPVAAMRAEVETGEASLRRRVLVGGLLAAAGATALGAGLFADPESPMPFVGGGILGLVLGVALASPVLGRPIVALLGLLYGRLFGTVGRMAEQNSLRNPRRTAATASALMIGVALVSMMAVFGASAKASIGKVLDDQVAGDLVVSNAVGMPFSSKVTSQVAAVPGVASVTAVRWAAAEVGSEKDVFVVGVDPRGLGDVLRLEMRSGSTSALRGATVLVEAGRAAETGVRVGSRLELGAGDRHVPVTVAGTYVDTPVVGARYVVGLDTLTALGVAAQDNAAYVTLAPGADRRVVERAIEGVVRDMPLVTLKDQAAYAQEQQAPVDQLLRLIYALLGLAVVIGVLGIVNTLGLSVIERTREIGLLRAIGLSRGQLRGMLTLEAVVIAVLGATLGVVLGLGFGVAVQRALADEGFAVLAVPWGQVAGFLGAAVVVGLLASLWPGRRAARLDVLTAIATE